MVLPRIQEAEPWLEDDEENLHKYLELHQTSQDKLRVKSLTKPMNIAGTMTTIAKASAYSYLIFTIISRSPIARMIISSMKHFIGKYHSLSSIILIVLVTLLTHIKLNQIS
ncbi:hypothetical protein SteCoe_495 [Stentor coeruleus]|uniref:Uncharacterized protein n=1 Tax=Stentor coeruleus TaxID=5963 RepID=A0A1R2D3X1_9CILI|nr:hypothetical protein SteCoe_495 [Stentor coeruleus]